MKTKIAVAVNTLREKEILGTSNNQNEQRTKYLQGRELPAWSDLTSTVGGSSDSSTGEISSVPVEGSGTEGSDVL